jgi:hypothetical protein
VREQKPAMWRKHRNESVAKAHRLRSSIPAVQRPP